MTYARYDYAWQTPGWSAQNPVVPAPAANGYLDPGLPSDVSLVRVYGKFMEMATGRDLEGVFRVRSKFPLLHVPSGSYLPSGEIMRRRFTMYRPLDVYLPATDDPQLVAEGQWHYDAILTVRGKQTAFAFDLPAGLGEVNIVDLVPGDSDGLLLG